MNVRRIMVSFLGGPSWAREILGLKESEFAFFDSLLGKEENWGYTKRGVSVYLSTITI